jgi:hypothetical protein
MSRVGRGLGAPEWLLIVGAALFVVVLFVAAVFEADIRWLHFFQAWMYVAAVVLALRGNRWGYFIGISAAGFWDFANVFLTTFAANGLHEVSSWLATGQLRRPDQAIAVPAFVGNLLVIVGCVWAYLRHARPAPRDAWRFVTAFALTTAFFAADMALFQPRYLVLFTRVLHPRWRSTSGGGH